MSTVKEIESVLSNLIKNGDRETLNDVIELLEKIATFKGTGSRPKKKLEENYEEDEDYVPRKPVFKNSSDHASALLGMMSETPRIPTQVYYSGSNYQNVPTRPSAAEYIPEDNFDPRQFMNVPQNIPQNPAMNIPQDDMMNHAGALL